MNSILVNVSYLSYKLCDILVNDKTYVSYEYQSIYMEAVFEMSDELLDNFIDKSINTLAFKYICNVILIKNSIFQIALNLIIFHYF